MSGILLLTNRIVRNAIASLHRSLATFVATHLSVCPCFKVACIVIQLCGPFKNPSTPSKR